MASKKPPSYPAQFEAAADFVQSGISTISEAVAGVKKFVSTEPEDSSELNLFKREIVEPLKGVGKWALFDLWPGLKKITRGFAGMVLAPVIALAGAATGIPPTEVNSLIGGLNTAEGWGGVWRKFKDLSEKHLTAWRGMTGSQKVLEVLKRGGSLLVNPVMGGISGFFNTGLANVGGGGLTIAGGLGRLQKKLKKETMVYQVFEKTTPFGKIADLVGDATQTLETIVNSSNMWGELASRIARLSWVKKIISPERLKLWEAYGNDVLIAASKGDKDAIVKMVKHGVMEIAQQAAPHVEEHVEDLAQRFGASQQQLEQVKRLAKGDLGALNEVVRNFIPGFDIKDAKSFMNFTATVKQTFTQAITQFSAKYVPGADFEKVTVGMSDLLGFKGAALAGVANKLGEMGKKALNDNFETIRAKGDKMVAAAADFVKNIQDPNLREKMGYTMAAGNIQEALQALAQQKASPDFIQKIHTFKLLDSKGREQILDAKALNAFKEKAIAQIAKVAKTKEATPVHSMPSQLK